MDTTTNEFLTVPAAAKAIGRTKVTLYRWIERQKIVTIRFGGILFIPASEVKRLKEATTNDPH